MDQLTGKVAVVTGGASGIGLALAKAFAAEQMRVVVADVEEAALGAAKAELEAAGATVHAVVCDVSDAAAVDRLRDETVATFGAAHVICNNAGVGGGGQIWDVPLATWEWVFGVNFWGVVNGIRSFVPLLLEQGEGHVVNTASAAGLTTVPFMGPYNATKHAVVAISEVLQMELDLAGRGVNASVLCPMWVRTNIAESDRNAPAAVRDAGGATELGEGANTALRDVIKGLIAGGMPPEEVAAHVVSAVKTPSFWVLPHDEVRAAALARVQRMANGERPQVMFGPPPEDA